MTDLPPLFGEHHVCDPCSIDYRSLTVERSLQMVGDVVDWLGDALPRLPAPTLRRRAAPGEWSTLEYACHFRDVLITFAGRVHRGVVEDGPVLDPMYADWRARRFDYNGVALGTLLDELEVGRAGYVDEVRSVPEHAWGREVTRRPDEVRTVRWLVRQTAHEGVHHRHDIERILATPD